MSETIPPPPPSRPHKHQNENQIILLFQQKKVISLRVLKDIRYLGFATSKIKLSIS